MSAKPLCVGVLRSVALPAALVVLLGGCAGTTRSVSGPVTPPPAATKPPAAVNLVPTNPPSDLGAVERFAWQQVVQLGDAFAKGDVDGFLSRVSRGFYRGYSQLEKSLKALMDNATARAAVVAVRLVSEEDGKVSVRAEWTRSVTLRDGSVELRHGETVFLFLKTDTNLRLLDYRGDAPFAIDGI
jgi:hypothetical protein